MPVLGGFFSFRESLENCHRMHPNAIFSVTNLSLAFFHASIGRNPIFAQTRFFRHLHTLRPLSVPVLSLICHAPARSPRRRVSGRMSPRELETRSPGPAPGVLTVASGAARQPVALDLRLPLPVAGAVGFPSVPPDARAAASARPCCAVMRKISRTLESIIRATSCALLGSFK